MSLTKRDSPIGPATKRPCIDYGKDDEALPYIGRLTRRMERCLKELCADPLSDNVMTKIESMSTLIHESMSISSRDYHSVQHVFDVSKHLVDPITILAALFHDCVYYNIDGGLSKIQSEKLRGVLLIEKEANGQTILRISPDAGSDKDEVLAIVIEIFGRKPGDELTPMTGLNEFLSAAIAVRELAFALAKEELAAIACCIEATIPFRPTDPLLGSPLDRLYHRMLTTTDKFKLNLTEDQCVLCVQRAADLANEDVGNFGSDDRLWFLDNTWSLLPESNEALRHQFLYTVKEFQFGLFKMYGFFGFLKPNVIFSQFRGVPSNEELDRLISNAKRNLEVGRKYVGAKLLSLSVLAAIAELTGGDAPVSVFMGDLPSQQQSSNRLENWLPEPKKEPNEKCDADVYEILAFGRRSECSFDVRHSPLAAYFYSFLGDEGVERILQEVAVYPMDLTKAKRLLTNLPKEAAIHVTESMAKLAMPRREMIASQVVPLLTAA